ncbi:Alpha-ketoglutarate-dependent dioxygenase AlkB [Alteromonas sp. 38]|uniref:alpha-ketoglutarate-dependent dioxygenase AlkB family protein n=1 Tax=Alteromonas TaxID=226 RepID=UPI0012F235C8|nr:MULTISPECIES: alpha-ketoglutarate-dependent dioxygenase AlkB [Alteromonas]CAD5291578.1 Alpha-ketoglutarate-dependent dioxygenase AlkB [Alteromonas sp. 154]VXB19635.1 Alpha-ketoglutarate-dependent dioxygenase AlkB [Alteromonas sp. 38]
MQLPLFTDAKAAKNSPITLPLPEAEVRYYPQWLSSEQANDYQGVFESTLPWRQDTIRMYGKYLDVPRLQAWHGDPECLYKYSGIKLAPQPWTPELAVIRDKCIEVCHIPFNSVLANWYRHGQDSMSMHADDEPELGPNPVVASVTFGESRPFVFKHKETGARFTQILEHGSLLVMGETTQSQYLHGIAKTTKHIGGRINLTFRHLITTK